MIKVTGMFASRLTGGVWKVRVLTTLSIYALRADGAPQLNMGDAITM
jgi:hypothetical protein